MSANVDPHQMRIKVAKDIAERTKVIDQHRRELCEYLTSKPTDDEICAKVDQMCMEYRTLGHLEGELFMSGIWDSVVNKKTETEEPKTAFF